MELSSVEGTEILQYEGKWRSRSVNYWRGSLDGIMKLIPKFEIADFNIGPDSPINPYLRTVVRLPNTRLENPIPVGVVSHSYQLIQHHEIIQACLDGLKQFSLQPRDLEFEVGLSEFGEWMNLAVYLPTIYDQIWGNDRLRLRIECFNSVEGSSRLVFLLGWYRFVCSNGLIIGKTKTEIRAIHNGGVNLGELPKAIADSMEDVEKERERLSRLRESNFDANKFSNWINGQLSNNWGKIAACRVFHICSNGHDVEVDSFSPGSATEKKVNRLCPVPGSPSTATSAYDVVQAMSWVATRRKNTEDRVTWQTSITDLVNSLILT